MRNVDQVLSQFPGPVTLPAAPRNWRWAALFAAAGGVLLLVQAITGPITGAEQFFAALTALLLVAGATILMWMQLRLPPHGNFLVLAGDGFTWRQGDQDTRVGWNEITGFRVYSWDLILDITGMGTVEYLFKPGPGEAADTERFDALPNRYGFRAGQLARLMNEWRARACGDAIG